MHRCLSVVEVQHAVFRKLGDRREAEAILAGLARTCRTFSNTALDVLWENLDSVIHLIRCLPESLWKVEHGTMTFQRDMLLSDWEIFFRYSSRVRTLYGFSCRRCCSNLSADVIYALTQTPSYGPLVPNLKSLCWLEPKKEYIPLLQQLLTCSLVHVELPCFVLRSHTISMQLISRCPSLKNLCTQDTKVPEELANVPPSISQKISSSTILRLHSLTSLHLDGCTLDGAAIDHLAHLPSLTELSLCLPDDIQSESLALSVAPPAFASLRSLALQAGELSILTSFLESVHIKPRSVSFRAVWNPTSEEIHLFFIALVEACDPELLSDISLTIDSPDEWLFTNEREQVSLSTFQQLLRLHNVESFVFHAMCNIFFDDDAIDTLTKHWPKLVHLFLNSSYRWGIPSRVTHRGLITLLSRCAGLTSFGLEVNFTEIDLPHSQIPTWRPGNGLTSCCRSAFFIESEIVHPTTIAAFLSDLCPELKVDACRESFEDDRSESVSAYGKRWEEVNFLLPAFSAVRGQCMEWYKKQQESTSGDHPVV